MRSNLRMVTLPCLLLVRVKLASSWLRLKRLGVPTLVIDKAERLGDAWRERYRSLYATWSSLCPYLPMPQVPRRLADVHPKGQDGGVARNIRQDVGTQRGEHFLRANEYCILLITRLQWMKSEVIPGSTVYDDESETWSISILRGDGSVREINCQHVIQATGLA